MFIFIYTVQCISKKKASCSRKESHFSLKKQVQIVFFLLIVLSVSISNKFHKNKLLPLVNKSKLINCIFFISDLQSGERRKCQPASPDDQVNCSSKVIGLQTRAASSKVISNCALARQLGQVAKRCCHGHSTVEGIAQIPDHNARK